MTTAVNSAAIAPKDFNDFMVISCFCFYYQLFSKTLAIPIID